MKSLMRRLSSENSPEKTDSPFSVHSTTYRDNLYIKYEQLRSKKIKEKKRKGIKVTKVGAKWAWEVLGFGA